MKERGWLYTFGSGLQPDPAASCIAGWVSTGRLDELERAFGQEKYRTGDLQDCFSPTFLQWLGSLDKPFGLADLAEMSWPDFSLLAIRHVPRLRSLLHERLFERLGLLVIWRLARVIGRVASLVQPAAPCPPDWPSRYPPLANVFFGLQGLQADRQTRAEVSVRVTATTRAALPKPFIWWDVDGARVVAVFPPFPVGPATRAGRTVSGADAGTASLARPRWLADRRNVQRHTGPSRLLHDFGPVGLCGEASVSPGTSIPFARRLQSLHSLYARRTFDRCRCLRRPLAAGRRLPRPCTRVWGGRTSTPAWGGGRRGDHFRPQWLARLARVPRPVAARGVGQPYEVAGIALPSWAADAPPDCGVEFDHILPVWLSGCPRIRFAKPDRFADAVLEVEGGGLRTPVQLRVGTNVRRQGRGWQVPRSCSRIAWTAVRNDRRGLPSVRRTIGRAAPSALLPAGSRGVLVRRGS